MPLNELPEDVLIRIFQNLCFHCQNPGRFVNADTPSTIQDKKTLAFLCRTSKALSYVSQPILYHYYATGNLEKERRRWPASMSIHGPPWEHDFFPEFIRTILLRPDLAAFVKSLQVVQDRSLWYGQDPGERREKRYAHHVDVMRLVIDVANKRDLLPWNVERYGRERWLGMRDEQLDHRDLLRIGLQCMPRVHTLLWAQSFGGDFNSPQYGPNHEKLPPIISFPSLKTVGLIRASNDYGLKEVNELFWAAPNLEALYACDAGNWSTEWPELNSEPGHGYIDVEMIGLFRFRKLVVDSLSTTAFENFIWDLTDSINDWEEERDGKFARLEDLEYYWEHWNDFGFNLDWVLSLLKDSLKRISLAYLPYSLYRGHYDEDIEDEEKFANRVEAPWSPPRSDYDPISSLATFPLLVDISLDCRSIYRPNDADAHSRLISFLPRSVARFRISYTFRSVANGLEQLGIQAPEALPNLQQVIVGIPDRIHEQYAHDVETMKALGIKSLFEQGGVRFAWAVDELGADSRTIVPGATVGPRLVPVPGLEERTIDSLLSLPRY
ncbi:hypothetical protein DM02DRAFT_651803 [Periconia macrospinosa]|uniref:Uncharacterized protein n=1 Tax=Periconia macrospinosa TaxID=97972 RepID=A0A2V1E0W3_9PLEO|nr:hypothetical protein DM02DRAFT_651803 [Periconia macrospinosa]